MAFRRVFATIGSLALLSVPSAPAYAQAKPQEKAQERKLSNEDKKDYVDLMAVVDGVASGKQPAPPSDVKLKFTNHFLKSGTNAYIPYTLEVSGGKFSAFPVAMYIRAVQKGAGAPAPAPATAKPADSGEKPSGDKPEAKAPQYAFADVYFLTEKNIVPGAAPDTTEIARALELPAGDFDIYIAMRERASKDKKAAPPKTVVHVQPLTVPDLKTGLTTSSVILAKSIDPAPQQLNAEQQLDQPYTISGYKIVPRPSASVGKAEELMFVFFIYNEVAAATGKPDLDVDYNFFHAGEEKPFSKLATTSFNATTLPGEFNVASGHQVFVGQGIPLSTFTPGDYKLEIKVTDKTNSQTVNRDVPFTVTP